MTAWDGFDRRIRKYLVGALCAMGVVCFLSATPSSASAGRWSPPVAVGGPAIQDLVFGPGNVPWALFEDGYESRGAPQIARLTSRYLLVDRHRIPAVPGYRRSDRLYVNRKGAGAVLSNLMQDCYACLGPPMGVGVSAWRPGKAPSRPLVLTGNRVGDPSIAIGSTGTIAVAITSTGRFTVAWTSAEKTQMAVGGVAGDSPSIAMPLQRRPTGFTERFQQLALTTTGRVVAIWQAESGFPVSKGFIEAATSVDGIHFSPPKRISPTNWCGDALLAPDRVGGVLVSWKCRRSRRDNGYSHYRP
jgi:hypothetical protein